MYQNSTVPGPLEVRVMQMETLVRSLLDPEMYGHAVTAEIRNHARRVLGLTKMEPETVQDMPDMPDMPGAKLPPRDVMESALRFYERSPDGQYDIDVVVPVLEFMLDKHPPLCVSKEQHDAFLAAVLSANELFDELPFTPALPGPYVYTREQPK